MFIPKSFEVTDRNELVEFIRHNSFGILFSQTEQGPFATHLPFLLEEQEGTEGRLVGHLAKANPHWQQLAHQEVLVVFPGPHAYISPTWYGEPNTVPTWNYVAVHVYGEFVPVHDKELLVGTLNASVEQYESGMPQPWSVDYDNPYVDNLMNGIVGFEIKISRIEGKWKLSQNHSLQRQQNVIAALRQVEDYDSKEIADLMEANVKKGGNDK